MYSRIAPEALPIGVARVRVLHNTYNGCMYSRIAADALLIGDARVRVLHNTYYGGMYGGMYGVCTAE